jgi:glutamate/tyrosine decarboxylase-like PLP-dependent enzyme
MLLLDEAGRAALWRRLGEIVEGHVEGVRALPVAPRLDPSGLRAGLERVTFDVPMDPVAALDLAAEGLRRHQVHTPHPRYFGLFNPAPATMGIAADALVAAFNPQIAAWSHSPFAAEVERHLVRAFGRRLGYGDADGVFCSGGAEANHSALLAALAASFPAFGERGVRALDAQPVLYVSAEAHHSFLKAARLSGLGTAAVREVAVDASLRMDVGALRARIAADRRAGHAPFLVVATAGTTGAGAIDPMSEVADVAAEERLWMHADAAWAGAVALAPEMAPLLRGIERADSITVDAHKWLSVPMGAGMVLTRHPQALERAFRVAAAYMPREAEGLDIVDPFAHSMQWSRRFIGLKLFLTLAVAGWDGYARAIREMTAAGDALRERLGRAGWRVVNDTPLPLACFVDGAHAGGAGAHYLSRVAAAVLASGQAWISTLTLSGPRPALRACITNHRTGPEDLDALVAALAAARETALAPPAPTRA